MSLLTDPVTRTVLFVRLQQIDRFVFRDLPWPRKGALLREDILGMHWAGHARMPSGRYTAVTRGSSGDAACCLRYLFTLRVGVHDYLLLTKSMKPR